MKNNRFAAIWLILVLLSLQFIPACAAGGPTITAHPQDCTVEAGGSCSFSAAAKGHTGTTWRICSADGSEDFPFTDALEYFPGLEISGKNANRLTLKNIPAEMDGWLIYCRYGTKHVRVDTRTATLTVTGGERADESHGAMGIRASDEDADETDEADIDAPESDGEAARYVAPMGGERILRTVGCYIEFVDSKGKVSGDAFDELNFGESYYNTATRKNVTDGSVDVRITAEIPKGQKIAYWVINGAKYTFNTEVKSFTLRQVPYAMTIEAVPANAKGAQTLLSADQIQQMRTGDPLLVESKNARMSHVSASLKPDGGTFTEFDFTHDFVNRATGAQEQGGRVTVRVAASIPEKKVVTYWLFGGARLNFNSDVTDFVVENLPENMLYQPVFHTKTTPRPTAAPTPAPTAVPQYSVSCSGCTFSGGGYSGATSGTVPYGTKITVKPNSGSSLGHWTGSHSAGDAYNGVSNASITYTVKKNCSFHWHAQIN